jgi:two-component system phosphate regulon sensor histidine kinase PhoR
MFHSIRWRIAFTYVSLIILTMLGVGIYITNFVRQNYLRDLENELTSEARLASDIIAPYFSGTPNPTKLDALAKSWADILSVRITIIAADGTVLGESHEDRTQMDNHATRPEILQARQNGQGSSIRFSQTLGVNLMYAAVETRLNGVLVGFTRVALPLSQVDQNVANLQRALIAITLLITTVAIVLALWIAARSLRPLHDLSLAVHEISTGDLSQIKHIDLATQSGRDEFGELARAFNSMSANLSAQIGALETERSKGEAVLTVMTDGVLIVDADGIVQLINAAAEAMFSVDQEHAIRHSLAEVLRHHQIIELWQSCAKTNTLQAAALEINPQKLYAQCIATPLGERMPGSILLLFQDLTRLRRLETVRQDFISNISHELRTPLASLKALTETLQDDALEDPPAARRFLQQMETEVDSLSLMVSELLELSRIESGRVPLKMQAITPYTLVSQAVERLRLQAERAELELSVDCADDLPAILADPTRLEQVMVNLLHNAIKFTPAGGTVLVKAEQQSEKVLFLVKDTGVGIPADDLPRIFERFYKADRARSGGGTGLGLAISRHLVEAHGGRIWVESIEGRGSTFSFVIPLAG